LLSGNRGQQLRDWYNLGKQQIGSLLKTLGRNTLHRPMMGLVINPQHLKLLKIKTSSDQHEVQFFRMMELPEGAMTGFEIKNPEIITDCLKQIIAESNIDDQQEVVFAIPRSSTIVKTILVDPRLHTDEIESRVWLEANRLFPNLIGEIYLDFFVNGPSQQEPTQQEVLIVACRKEQLNPYLNAIEEAGFKVRVVDINYYAYERALPLILKDSPEKKSIAFLNINFGLIDLLGVFEGKLVYAHELAYDGHHLLKLCRSTDNADFNQETNQENILKTTLGLHLKHILQFFYSSRPNMRLDRIILGGDVPACIDGVVEFVTKEVGKEVVMADPVAGMKLAANVDADTLKHFSPALMLCCGVALTRSDI